MTNRQRLEELTDRYISYDDHRVHVDTNRQSVNLDLDRRAYHLGITKLAEPAITVSPKDLEDVYGVITYDEHPTYISTHRAGAHLKYVAPPTPKDEFEGETTMMDDMNREPLLTTSQVHNALSTLKASRASHVFSQKLTSVHIGGEPRSERSRRPYTFNITYTDLRQPIEREPFYRATTNVVTRPDGERQNDDPPHD